VASTAVKSSNVTVLGSGDVGRSAVYGRYNSCSRHCLVARLH
jgi:hypothetical protein